MFLVCGCAFAPSAAADGDKEDEQSQLLIMDLVAAKGVEKHEAETLTGLLADEAARYEIFRTVSQTDLRTMVELEGERQHLGCEETSCLAELAGAIGARFVLYGRVSRLGSRVILQLNLLDSREGRPLGRRSIKASDLGELADSMAGAADDVLEPGMKLVAPDWAKAREKARKASAAAKVRQEEKAAERAKKDAAKNGGKEGEKDGRGPKDEDEDEGDFEEEGDLEVLSGDRPTQEPVRSTKKDVGVKGLAGTHASFIVDAPRDVVMDALWKPELFHEVLPGGKKTELKRKGRDKKRRRYAEVTLAEKALFVRLAYTLRLIRDDKRKQVTFREIDGDVEHVRGAFKLKKTDDPNYTEVHYTVFVKVGKLFPSSWARSILSDQPAEMAEILRERSRELAPPQRSKTAKASEKKKDSAKSSSEKKKAKKSSKKKKKKKKRSKRRRR